MFSLSQINNKKAFLLLSIIAFTTINLQCSEEGSGVFAKNCGTKSNPFIIKIDNSQPDESALVSAGKFILPIVAGAAINYILQQWTTDPEMQALLKEEKQLELQIKRHPDYPTIKIQQQKIETEAKENDNKERRLQSSLNQANLIQHHKEELDLYRKCDHPLTQKFCQDMTIIHMNALEELLNR